MVKLSRWIYREHGGEIDNRESRLSLQKSLQLDMSGLRERERKREKKKSTREGFIEQMSPLPKVVPHCLPLKVLPISQKLWVLFLMAKSRAVSTNPTTNQPNHLFLFVVGTR
jgi:hypothetical protein